MREGNSPVRKAKRVVLQVRLSEDLRARVEDCARLEGLGVGEYAREALRRRCEETERLEGQRSRARSRAAALDRDEEGQS